MCFVFISATYVYIFLCLWNRNRFFGSRTNKHFYYSKNLVTNVCVCRLITIYTATDLLQMQWFNYGYSIAFFRKPWLIFYKGRFLLSFRISLFKYFCGYNVGFCVFKLTLHQYIFHRLGANELKYTNKLCQCPTDEFLLMGFWVIGCR